MIGTGQNLNAKSIFTSRLADTKRPAMAEIIRAARASSLTNSLTRNGPIKPLDTVSLLKHVAAGIVDGTIKTEDRKLRLTASGLTCSIGPISLMDIQAAARAEARRRGISGHLLFDPIAAPGKISAAMERARVGYENQLVGSFRRPLQQLVPITPGQAECVFAAVDSNRETDREN